MTERRSSGHKAMMLVLHTPPSARRVVTLFPNSTAIGLNAIAYHLMPEGGTINSFKLWHQAFRRSHCRPARALSARSP